MAEDDKDDEKTLEPTPEKLRQAREKGDVPKSQDVMTCSVYLGFLIAFYIFGGDAVDSLGTVMMSFLDQPDRLVSVFFSDAQAAPIASYLMIDASLAVLPIFVIPMVMVLLAVFAQNAFVVAPSKLEPKLSKLSIIQNAKSKFGRSGLFEFAKSFVKLLLYSVTLGVYVTYRAPEMVAAVGGDAVTIVPYIAQLAMEFMVIALIISAVIGGIDASFQQAEFKRKHMMSFQDMKDEVKQNEGDQSAKGQRKQKGQQIVKKQLKTAVPKADVIIVNPTHYAVALQWSRLPGAAPVCVAKGVDEVAAIIREIAQEHGVPIHSDPPTARAIYAAIEVGQEIEETHYAPVAAAIRFAEEMRQKMKGRI